MNLARCLFLALSLAPLLVGQTKFATDLLALNPVGYWPLHGNANDLSTRGNNGTLKGVTFNGFVGPLGTGAAPAAAFSSALQQRVTVSGGGALFNQDGLHPFSVMAWVRTMSQGQDFLVIAGKFDIVANTGWALGMDGVTGRLALIFQSANKDVLGAETLVSVNDGNWHLLSATYDGGGKSSGIRLYIDGVSFATDFKADTSGLASTVNSAPLTIGGATNGEASFEGLLNEVAIFNFALTPEQNLQLALDAQGFRRVLPQFAFGDGWYSAVYFTNNGTAPVTFPVSFLKEDGTPLNVPSIGNSKTLTLAPGATTVIEAPNTGTLVQGYVSAVLPIGITGYGVFRQSVAGIPDQEAVVPLSGVGAGYQGLLYDETSNLVTGVAIVNPSSVTTTLTVTVTDTNGNSVGTSTLALQAQSKTAVALRNLPGLSRIVGTQGTAVFTVTAPTNGTGAVAVLGLRFRGAAFTSIPAFGRAGI